MTDGKDGKEVGSPMCWEVLTLSLSLVDHPRIPKANANCSSKLETDTKTYRRKNPFLSPGWCSQVSKKFQLVQACSAQAGLPDTKDYIVVKNTFIDLDDEPRWHFEWQEEGRREKRSSWNHFGRDWSSPEVWRCLVCSHVWNPEIPEKVWTFAGCWSTDDILFPFSFSFSFLANRIFTDWGLRCRGQETDPFTLCLNAGQIRTERRGVTLWHLWHVLPLHKLGEALVE